MSESRELISWTEWTESRELISWADVARWARELAELAERLERMTPVERAPHGEGETHTDPMREADDRALALRGAVPAAKRATYAQAAAGELSTAELVTLFGVSRTRFTTALSKGAARSR